jgi:DNA excision repair protein ERCC-4
VSEVSDAFRLCLPSKSELTVTEAIENIQVTVDDRERPSEVVAELEKLGGVVVKIEHLALGDYSIDGAVLIERKTAADFAQSLIDGRLFRQAGRMANSRLRPAYIIEGTNAEWSVLGVSRQALQGALVTLMLIFDIPVFRSSGPAESAHLILYVGSQLARLRDPEYLPYRQAKAKRKKSRQLRILQSLPGVGPDRAKRLLERFGTVRACFVASAAELIEVEGIGPKTAAAIDHVISGCRKSKCARRRDAHY